MLPPEIKARFKAPRRHRRLHKVGHIAGRRTGVAEFWEHPWPPRFTQGVGYQTRVNEKCPPFRGIGALTTRGHKAQLPGDFLFHSCPFTTAD
jgi:hypothetical protein